MFVSIDETEDKKYENETRNFFTALQRCNSQQKWQSILDEDNAKILKSEMTKTLVDVNRFITKIEIESSILNQPNYLTREEEKKFKEYLAMGRELITKLKVLVTLEKASAMEKYEQSHVRKLSHAATEDTASGVDTESVIDGLGTFSKEGSFDRRDSRTISLVHKYAASFTEHYEIFDKLNHDVEEIVDRFNVILDFIHKQLQFRASGIIMHQDAAKTEEPSEKRPIPPIKRPSFDDADSENEVQRTPSSEAKMAVDILKEHLQRSSLFALYKHVNTSGPGHLIEHTYYCSVAGLHSDGKSRKKSKAKEEAAVQMIRQLINKQKCNSLPTQVVPFTDYQISEISAILNEREELIDKLEETCLRSHEPPPLYTVLSETGKSNEPFYTIKCEAMGYTALGHGSEKLEAKKNAVKSILNLVTTRKMQ